MTPLVFLRELVTRVGGSFEASFQSYRWTPGVEDVVEFRKFDRDEILGTALSSWLENLPRGVEAGLCSKVRAAGVSVHIPMVDFASPVDKLWVAHKPPPKELMGAQFFKTQRSFHAYGTEFMQDERFTPFMAQCLLMNRPMGNSYTLHCLVDPLWVGWQLLRQFAVLRVTANSDRWNTVPVSIENPIGKWSVNP